MTGEFSSHGDMPSVDIVLGVYNKPNLVSNCVESVLKWTHYPRWRLTLVDDGCDEVTRQLLQAYASEVRQVRCVRNEENLGFIGTYNRGIAMSDADYVLLLNTDTMVTPGWLGKLVDIAQSDPSIAMVNPLSNELVNLSIPMVPGTSFVAMNELLEAENPPPFDIVTAIGYCLLVRRDVLRTHGSLDEVFGRGYCEDTDLHMRLTTRGYRVVAAPNTYIYHLGHGTFSSQTAAERYEHNIQIFRSRWGEQFDRDIAQFREADPMRPLLDSFPEPPAIHSPSEQPPPRSWTVRAIRMLANNRRKLLPMLFRPKRAMVAVCRRVVAAHDAAIIQSQQPPDKVAGLSAPAYFERYTRKKAPSVVFVVDGLGLYGGVLRIIDLMNRLIRHGVEARLAVANATEVDEKVLKRACFAPMYFGDYEKLVANLPRCDVAVATFWPTVSAVHELVASGRAGAGVNFLQDFEPWFYSDQQITAKVRETYPLLPNRVVTSQWLKGVMRQHGFDAHVIPLGFDALEFYRTSPNLRSVPRIIAMARPETPYRGFDDLVAALRRVHEHAPHVEFALFGSKRLGKFRESLDFPIIDLGVIESRTQLNREYERSHIFVDPSHFQGFGLPALEAMACHLACVLTNVGGVHEYVRDDVNALMVSPCDPIAISDAVLRLAEDATLRRRLGEEGRKTVLGLSPEREANAWVGYLADISPAFRHLVETSSPHKAVA